MYQPRILNFYTVVDCDQLALTEIKTRIKIQLFLPNEKFFNG